MLLGRYEVIRKLGTGGFGEVLLARSLGAEGFERIVALKRLKGELARKEGSLQGIINEARIGGLLSHPNVVQVLEFIQVESDYLLVMEYVDGIGLQEVMELERNHLTRLLNPTLAFDVAIQACEGLHYAHAARAATGQPLKLIHRDIKPSNLMITRTGTVKVMDFGVARSVTNTGQSSTGSIKGTLRYLSPEQAEGSKEIRHESDLFSLGLVLTELIIGHPVYDADQEHVVLLKALQARVESGVEEAEKLVSGLGPVLKRCLAKNPEDRFRTADELAQALRTLRARQPATDSSLASLVEKAMVLRTPDPFQDELSTDTTFSLELRRKELVETRAMEGRSGRGRGMSPGRVPDSRYAERRKLLGSSPLVQIPGPRPGGDAPTEDMPRHIVQDILQKAAGDPWEWEWRLHEQDGKSWVGEVFDRASPPSSPMVPVKPPPREVQLLHQRTKTGQEPHQNRATDPGRGRLGGGAAPQESSPGHTLPGSPQPPQASGKPLTAPVRSPGGQETPPPPPSRVSSPRLEVGRLESRPAAPKPADSRPPETSEATSGASGAPTPAPAIVSLWGDMLDLKALHETSPGLPIPSAGITSSELVPLQPQTDPSRRPSAPREGAHPGGDGSPLPSSPSAWSQSNPSNKSQERVQSELGEAPRAASLAAPSDSQRSVSAAEGSDRGSSSPAAATPKARAKEMADWESRSTTQMERSALHELLRHAKNELAAQSGAEHPGPGAEPKSAEPKSAEPKSAEPKSAEPKSLESRRAESPGLPGPLVDPVHVAPLPSLAAPHQRAEASPSQRDNISTALPAKAPAPASALPAPVPAPLEEVDALDDDEEEESASEVSRMDMLAELESISIPSSHVAVIQQRMMIPTSERKKPRKPSITEPRARALHERESGPLDGTGAVSPDSGPARESQKTPLTEERGPAAEPAGSTSAPLGRAVHPPPSLTTSGMAAPNAAIDAGQVPSDGAAARSQPAGTTSGKLAAPVPGGASATLSSTAAALGTETKAKRTDDDEDDEPSTGTISKRLRTARDRTAPKPFVTDTGEFSITVTKMLLDAALKEEAEKAMAHLKPDARGHSADEVTDGPRSATRKVPLAQLVDKGPVAHAQTGKAAPLPPSSPPPAHSVPVGTPLDELPTRHSHPNPSKATSVSSPFDETTGPVARLASQSDLEAAPLLASSGASAGTRRLEARPGGGQSSSGRSEVPAETDSTRVMAPVQSVRQTQSTVLTVLGAEPSGAVRLTPSALAFGALLGLGLLAAGFLLGVFWERAQHAASTIQTSDSTTLPH